MSVSVDKLFNLVRLTRNTEYKRGSYVVLTEPLPDYPLFSALVKREVLRSTPTIRYQLSINPANSFEVTEVGDPLQVTVPKNAEAVVLTRSTIA